MRIPHTTQGLEVFFLFLPGGALPERRAKRLLLCSGKGLFPQLACLPRVVESLGDSFGELSGVLAL